MSRTLYVLCGLPFSGKTTYAGELLRHNAGLLIERDAFLETINHEPETLECLQEEARQVKRPISQLALDQGQNAFNDVLTREYGQRVKRAIQASSATTIVVDGTHLQPLSRAFVKDLQDWRAVAVIVDTDVEECVRRFEQAHVIHGVRSTITSDLIRNMARVFERPALTEGFAEVCVMRQNPS